MCEVAVTGKMTMMPDDEGPAGTRGSVHMTLSELLDLGLSVHVLEEAGRCKDVDGSRSSEKGGHCPETPSLTSRRSEGNLVLSAHAAT